MKKIYSILILLALAVSVYAQDARQRTVQTVVADVLAAMPAQNSADFATQMGDLAATAPQSVVEVAKMLKPAGDGVKNAVFEYALQGLVTYVNDPAHSAKKADVLKGLQDAAAACSDTYNKGLLTSLQRLLGDYVAPEAEAAMPVKQAQALLKSGQTHEKCLAAWTLMNAMPEKAVKTVASALKSDDKIFRNSVISNATKILGAPALVPVLTGKFKKLTPDAKVDVLNWLGNNKISSVANLVNGAFGEGGEVAKAAIAAAGKIGGAAAAKNLVGQLGGENSLEALTALKSFKGDIKDIVAAALTEKLATGNDMAAVKAIMDLASSRRMKNVAPTVFSMINSSDKEVSKMAITALPNFTGVGDIAKVGGLLDAATDKDLVDSYQGALESAIHTLSPAERYSKVSGLMKTAKNVANFYRVLASTGTDEAVGDLAKSWNAGSDQALSALALMDNYKAAPVLLDAAKKNPSKQELVLPRYISLLDQFFLLAGKYLDDKDVAYAAAGAIRNLASKTNEEIDYNTLKSNLDKAKTIFKAAGGADDGYAIDEINQVLEKAKPFTPSQLTAEEKKQGFEMLFDGTNLDKWQGDLEGYIPLNGTIYVSANYGSTGNLYTKKEYRNFVYRFEFCFLREGVNNGVGVRTPMGVDAAYDAMCEVQILDHDAPMYANLREYQVHGSVYGVIPAKRIVHKPLGEWSTEEIRVEGDRIKVTVNGEVIVDGNIRTACKGHNVAPDGSGENPYTVDHRNHPGMFNKKGYISFCGHGEGLKIRNVRILDLGDKK